jgi:hypothetical protein
MPKSRSGNKGRGDFKDRQGVVVTSQDLVRADRSTAVWSINPPLRSHWSHAPVRPASPGTASTKHQLLGLGEGLANDP